MGLFSGLESLGLGKMKEEEVFKKEEPKTSEDGAAVVAPKKQEIDVLFDKTFRCPVCDSEFPSKMIRAGKNKLIKQEMDLRAVYDMADVVKYEPVVCTRCGFAALNRFFKPIPPAQINLIKEKISSSFKGLPTIEGEYSYDDAILRYKLVLASTVVKCGKTSEKAYVCLKMAWAFRGKAENIPEDEPNREEVLKQIKAGEMECLQNAYEGFTAAYSQEDFPMCGMDELTVTYLTAALAYEIGKLDEAGRLASMVVTSKVAKERIKDKAREIKDLVKKKKEEVKKAAN